MDEGLIYDIGLNLGRDTAYYLHRGYRVLAIEANPLLAEQARRRFAEAIAGDRLTILAVGVGPERGTATFWVNERFHEWSAFSKEIGCRDGTPCHPVDVPCVPLAEILGEYGVPYYMKIDIEGHDRYCLEALSPQDLPRYLSIESQGVEHLHRLRALGYDRFKCVNQINHNDPRAQSAAWRRPLVRLRRNLGRMARDVVRRFTGRPDPTVEGGPGPDGTWIFPRGSSGPWGDDAPGPWRSLEAVEEDLAARERALALPRSRRPAIALNPKGWHDIHATRS